MASGYDKPVVEGVKPEDLLASTISIADQKGRPNSRLDLYFPRQFQVGNSAVLLPEKEVAWVVIKNSVWVSLQCSAL